MRIALILALFFAPLVLPLLAKCWRMRRWGLPVRVVVDPDLAEIAKRLDERPERMRIVFDGRNVRKRAISLDVETDHALRVTVEGHRASRVNLRGRWIPDHPVPLALGRRVLFVEPVDANRFRVMTAIPFSVPPVFYVACSLVATWGLVRLSPEILATAIGFAIGCTLAESRG